MKDDRSYIHLILDCVSRIDRYCQDGEETFRESELIQDAEGSSPAAPTIKQNADHVGATANSVE